MKIQNQLLLIAGFLISLSSAAQTSVVSGTTYRLMSACGAGDKVMAIAQSSMSNQALAVLATRAETSNAQVFRFENLGSSYKITALHSGKSLEVANNSLSNGAAIWQNDFASRPSQQFRLSTTGDGFVKLQAVSSGLYIDLSGARAVDGTRFQQYTSNSTCAQKFKLSAVVASTSWSFCANEGGVCNFSGTRTVRYGANGSYAYRTATSTIGCNNSVFGDPAYGVSKRCDYSDGGATLPPTTTTTSTTTTTILSPTTTTLPAPGTGSGTVGPTISTFRASGAITLTSGQTVTGLAISNPNGPCITGSGVSNVRITNNKIGPCGSTSSGNGISLNNARDILVDHNAFDNVASGLYVVNSTNNIVFDHNYATRIRGPMPRGQIVQFNGVNGSGHRITCNVSDQTTPGFLNGPEDHINIFNSFGTAASPILIKYNKIRGGGPSRSGGGIMLGDNGASYITVDKNILVNPGQYGIAVAGGHDNQLLNNKVYSARFDWNNIGAYVWSQSSPACYGHTVSGNRINYVNSSGMQNTWWNGGNCGPISMSGNVFPDLTLTSAIWNETFPECGQ